MKSRFAAFLLFVASVTPCLPGSHTPSNGPASRPAPAIAAPAAGGRAVTKAGFAGFTEAVLFIMATLRLRDQRSRHVAIFAHEQ